MHFKGIPCIRNGQTLTWKKKRDEGDRKDQNDLKTWNTIRLKMFHLCITSLIVLYYDACHMWNNASVFLEDKNHKEDHSVFGGSYWEVWLKKVRF